MSAEIRKPLARIKFLGRQSGFGNMPDFDLYNIVEVVGLPVGSTVTTETLRKHGYDWEVITELPTGCRQHVGEAP